MTALGVLLLGLAALVWIGWTPTVPRSLPPQRGRTPELAGTDFLPVVEAVGVAVEAGVAPSVACAQVCRVSAGTRPELAASLHELADAAERDETPDGWQVLAERHHSDGLRAVAAGWRLSELVGAPLGDSLDIAADLLRGERLRRSRLAAVVAGPRASMNLLTALPLLGCVVALALVDAVRELYLSPAAFVTAVPGIALVVLGRGWGRRMIRRATAVREVAS